MQETIYVCATVALLISQPVAAAINCGDQPNVRATPDNREESFKADAAGKAQLLSKFLPSADINGKVEQWSREQHQSYRNVDEQEKTLYSMWVSCQIISSSSQMTDIQKVQQWAQVSAAFSRVLFSDGRTGNDRFPACPEGHYTGTVANETRRTHGTISLDVNSAGPNCAVSIHTEITTKTDGRLEGLPAKDGSGFVLSGIFGFNFDCNMMFNYVGNLGTGSEMLRGNFQIYPRAGNNNIEQHYIFEARKFSPNIRSN